MLNEPTLEKLKAMRLHAMAAAWLEQQGDPDAAGLPFDERFGLLVDIEWVDRDNKRMQRYLRAAKLRLSQACIEDIDYAPERKLDKAVVRQLATCRWVHEHRAVVITGATGRGKTYLACALAMQAIRRGKKAMYRRASRLFDELLLSHADGTYAKVLARIAKFDVLVGTDRHPTWHRPDPPRPVPASATPNRRYTLRRPNTNPTPATSTNIPHPTTATRPL